MYLPPRCSSTTSTLLSLLSTLVLPFGHGSPIPDSRLAARQRVDCNDTKTTFDESCWNILDISGYLNHPVTGWNHTVPICTSEDLDDTCCIATEPWTTCYLRLAHGTGGTDCSQINAQFCSYDPTLNVDPRIQPYVAYTIKNIYGMSHYHPVPKICLTSQSTAINNLFTTWYIALQWALTQALSIVQDVINKLDPQTQTNFVLRDLLFALTVGLAYIAGPESAGLFGILAATATSANAILKGANQAPTVARGIWPAGTESSQDVQIANVENELNNATSETSAMLNAGLQLLMSDMTSFVNFASTGMFSGAEPLSLPTEVSGLDMALRTFIVSNAMSSNGWHAAVLVSVTREDVASNVSGDGCTWHGPNNEFCGDFIWYSDATEKAFVLASKKQLDGTIDLLNTIISKDWSTLPMLFDGAYNCTVAGNHGTPPVHIKADGTLDMSCMSQLDICIPCGSPCPIALVNGVCPFGPCNESNGSC